MAWFYLILASIFQIVGGLALKTMGGFDRPRRIVLPAASLTAAIVFLALAMRTLPMGVAYAVWTVFGVAGVAALGIAIFGESGHPARLFWIALIIICVAGLNLAP